MSILIKGMEMPVTCCHCPLMGYDPEIEWNDGGKETQGAYICVMTHELIDNTKRKEHCPLVLVPPHGRLIDADAEETVVHCNNEENARIIATLLNMDADGHYLTYSSIFGEEEEPAPPKE